MSFFSIEMGVRLKKSNVLIKINELLDWKKIEEKLKSEREYLGGQQPYDSVKMFKAVLLGQWYGLSDPELENALNVRVDFMMFSGFELMQSCPDETTLCRFRNWLVLKGLDKLLFKEINRQLEEKRIKIKECRGSIIDATIIESASRPKRVIEEIAQDRKEDSTNEETQSAEDNGASKYIQTQSKDPDARWLKKGNKSFFGYKGFARVDAEDGFIEDVLARPANESETKHLDNLTQDLESKKIYTDKAYHSEANQTLLKNKKLKNGIMHRAFRGHPLSAREKLRNKLISKIRFRVEQCFGTLKRKFGLARASYRGRFKVETQMRLKAICYNLLKAANKLEWAV